VNPVLKIRATLTTIRINRNSLPPKFSVPGTKSTGENT